MSIALDPIVANKLSHFARRRMWLIIARGLCAGIVTFLLCIAIVAAIDWYWLLSDRVRWGLSAAVYLPVIVVVWMTCLRRMLHLPAREEIATQVEQSEPQLRENLLSAVELATDDPGSLHDSPVFRGLLQGKVAQQMGRIQVPNLLPMKLVAKWFLAAVAVVAVAALLLMSADPRFRQLAARALLPGANIARVSRIHVEILQPTPHSLMLAEDETIAIVAEVTGGRFDEVTLETFTEKQGTTSQPMRGRSDAEFASNIHVKTESVEYRILAGDAVTQRFRIEARPRPRVTAFQKTYEYPEYALLPNETVTEPHGDLLVLEGTKTELLLELDQQVSEAELRIDPADSDELKVIALLPDHDDPTGLRWKATVPVDEAAIYKVHLVSKETGFENIFSPKYEIRPQPDLIPRAGFVDQQETTLLLPPNDILALKAMAEDDLPLDRLEQHVSVNGRDWIALPLDAKPNDDTGGRHITAEWKWDLLNHKLKTGDQVVTKLVATDRKGNIGESIPLRIIVAATDFDPERHTLMQRKLSLYDEFAKFSTSLQEHKVSALEAIERLRKPDQSLEQAALDRATLTDMAGKQREQAEQLLAEITKVEQDMPAGADAYELDLTGRVIARIQREHVNVPSFAFKAMQSATDENQRIGFLDEIKRTFEGTADTAKVVAEHYQTLMAHNFLSSVATDLDAMLRQQKLVVNSPTQSWDRLLRQETVSINQIKVLERLLRDERQRLPNFLEGHVKNLLNWSQSQRERLQDSMESEEKLPQLQNVAKDFYNQLQNQQRFDAVDGGLPGRIVNAWRDLDTRAGSLYVPIEQIAQATQQENQLTAQASGSSDSVDSKKLLDQAERFVAEVDLKLSRSLDQLRSRRELTQTRKDGDTQYASDAGLTHRATTSLLNQYRELPPQESTIPANLLEIAPAYRILEAGHELITARDTLNVLVNMERWDSQNLQSRIDHPRQWDLIQRGFELASQRLREAGVKNELVGPLDQIRWGTPMRDAGRKITERRWKREAMIGAGHEVVEIRDELAKVLKDLKPVMDEARAVIAKYSPTIPQMAQQAAEQLRKMEEATTETADAVEKDEAAKTPESPDTAQKLAALEQHQESINQQIEDLMEALVEDANAQNVLEESQRERARDADDSIAMIQEPATEMNRAMEKAQESPSNEQQAKDLAQAAEQQEKTAQALELVAEHFDKLEEGQDVAETRAELRQAERDMGIARQMDQQYENSEQLAQMANQDAQQLMTELEAELKQNPAMQQALSEISQNTLQEARNALEDAAQNEQNLQQNNERSDEDFQAKKRELAENLREMANEASQLSGQLVAQANQSAAQGKTPEAQQKFAEAQQKLNEAAAKANTAREEQLLEDLAQTAQETKAALAEATETLKQAEQQTETGKNAEVHADDKTREAQKKDSENRRNQFNEQQKRMARDQQKRVEDIRRRNEQQAQSAEKELKNANNRVQQAQNRLDKKPDDAGLKQNLAQEQNRQTASQDKDEAAKESLQKAEQRVQQEKKHVEEINNMPKPALDAPNPATQLADQYAEQAIKTAEELNQRAEQLAAAADFGSELNPQKKQLAAAEQQQQEVTQDVANTAEDVARAARHERRLENTNAAEPLQATANAIQQVAQNEATNAEQQLNSAAAEAEQGEANALANPQGNQPQPNAQTLQAQQGLETAENAIAQQADQIDAVLEPLLAAAEAAANQETGQAGEPPNGQTPSGQPAPPAGQQNGEPTQTPPANGEPASGQPANGEPANGEPASGQLASGQPSPPSFTPEQMARGQQLARTLDELDRQAAEAAANAAQPGQPVPPAPPSPSRLDSLAQAAQAQQSAQAAARTQAQQAAAMAMSEGGQESSDSSSNPPGVAEFGVLAVNRDEAAAWGKLRNKSAEDLTKGRSESVSEEYRKSVETYFRVLAERAKKK